jgi:hypothetical protein
MIEMASRLSDAYIEAMGLIIAMNDPGAGPGDDVELLGSLTRLIKENHNLLTYNHSRTYVRNSNRSNRRQTRGRRSSSYRNRPTVQTWVQPLIGVAISLGNKAVVHEFRLAHYNPKHKMEFVEGEPKMTAHAYATKEFDEHPLEDQSDMTSILRMLR